jgi:hypothetical protein
LWILVKSNNENIDPASPEKDKNAVMIIAVFTQGVNIMTALPQFAFCRACIIVCYQTVQACFGPGAKFWRTRRLCREQFVNRTQSIRDLLSGQSRFGNRGKWELQFFLNSSSIRPKNVRFIIGDVIMWVVSSHALVCFKTGLQL